MTDRTLVPDSPVAQTGEQWERVQELMRGFGAMADLDPEAYRVVRMLGGESKLRNTPVDAVQFVRRDFMELYGDAAEVAAREAGHRIASTPEGDRLTAEIMQKAIPPAA
jgi:hypothetical protein